MEIDFQFSISNFHDNYIQSVDMQALTLSVIFQDVYYSTVHQKVSEPRPSSTL